MKVVAYVPLKLNNERVPGKNTRELSDGTPLFHLILRALALVPSIDETYVYCSSREIKDALPLGTSFLERDAALDSSATRINEVMQSFANDVYSDVYLLAHATAPFLSSSSLATLVRTVTGGKHDSALTVVRLQEFLWADGLPLNYDPVFIPRTQDLPPIYAETTGAYAYTRNLVLQGRRVGSTPALVEVSKIEALDINESLDWDIASAVYDARLGESGPPPRSAPC